MQKVLILCTGNSCRSQMAEALLRTYGGDRFEVYSAGLEPHEIHPMTIQVMNEIGIDMTGYRSKDVKELLGRHAFSYVIFVCSHAEQNCPSIFPFSLIRLSWPFEDPADFSGSENQRLEKFRHVRDEIKNRIVSWLGEQPSMIAD